MQDNASDNDNYDIEYYEELLTECQNDEDIFYKEVYDDVTLDKIDDKNDTLNWFVKKINKIKPLNSQGLEERVKEAQAGDNEALWEVVQTAIRESTYIVENFYCNYKDLYCISFLDLIQESIFGIIQAVNNYDSDKNHNFISYYGMYMYQKLQRYLPECDVIRVPVHMFEQVKNLKKNYDKCISSYEKYIEFDTQKYVNKTINERLILSSLSTLPLAIDFDKVIYESIKFHLLFENEGRIKYFEANNFGLQQSEYSSFDSAINIDSNDNLNKFNLYSEPELNDDPENIVLKKFQKKLILEALDELDEREKKIIVKRYGIYDDNFRTLQSLGDEFGLSRERIRQIEKSGLRRLRHPKRNKYFKPILSFV